MIKACIFDFDGTLADSMQDVFISLNYAFSACGINVPALNPANIMQHQLPDAIVATVPSISREVKERVIEAFLIHYDAGGYPGTVLLPGVQETLAALYEQKIPCYIASNKRQIPILTVLNRTGLREYFRDIFTPDLFERPGIKKPKSELIADLVSRYHLNPHTTAYVGDMELDVIAAKENGLCAVAVVNGYGTAEHFRVKADFVMHRISEILEIAG